MNTFCEWIESINNEKKTSFEWIKMFLIMDKNFLGGLNIYPKWIKIHIKVNRENSEWIKILPKWIKILPKWIKNFPKWITISNINKKISAGGLKFFTDGLKFTTNWN